MKKPVIQNLEVLSDESNHAIVRAPGRSFPGMIVQGDTLVVLHGLARDVAKRLAELTTDEDDQLWAAQELHDALLDRVLVYQKVLDEYGIALPYSGPLSEQARLELVPIEDEEDYESEGPELTLEQRERVEALSDEALQDIDSALASAASTSSWRKVAMVVGAAMMDQPNRVAGIPDLYYAERLRGLIDTGMFLARGDIFQMRRCEVLLDKK